MLLGALLRGLGRQAERLAPPALECVEETVAAVVTAVELSGSVGRRKLPCNSRGNPGAPRCLLLVPRATERAPPVHLQSAPLGCDRLMLERQPALAPVLGCDRS